MFDENPKLATCKGGIVPKEAIEFDAIDEMKTSLLGTDGDTFASEIKYNALDESHLKKVAKMVSTFVDELFEIGNEKSFFANTFNASRKFSTEAKECCKKDLQEYTKQGLEAKQKDLDAWGSGKDVEIEETLFFYPLVAVLNRLALEIYNLKNQ